MAIVFRCACGKSMQAKEELAGKKVRCGGCGSIVVIPGGAAGAEVSAGPPPVTPYLEPAEGAESMEEPAFPPPMAPLPVSESREGFQPGSPPLPTSLSYSAKPAHWEGSSLGQREAPWDPEAKRRRDPYPTRRDLALWAKLLILLVVVGAVAGGGWFLYSWLKGKGTPESQLAMVPRDGTGFVTLRVADAWNSKGMEPVRTLFGAQADMVMKEKLGLGIGDIERLTVAMPDQDWKQMGAKRQPEMWTIIHTKVPMDKDKILGQIKGDRVESKVGGKVYYSSAMQDVALHFAGEKELWIAPPPVMPGLLDGSRKIATEGPLSASLDLAASNKHHLVIGFRVPEQVKEMMKEKGAPPEAAVLLELVSGSLALNLDEGGQLEARLKFTGEGAAAKAAEQGRGYLDLARTKLAEVRAEMKGKDIAFMPLDFGAVEKALAEIKIENQGDEVLVTVPGAGGTLAMGAGLVLPAVQKTREAAARTQATNNLKKILLGMHDYHDVYRKLPPARLNKGLSWRVAILPHIGEGALYNRFKLDEPWNSPHNFLLLEQMPPVFQLEGGVLAMRGQTHFQVFTGENLVFHPFLDRMSALDRIPDGTSNTLFVVEAARPVPWTQPEDIAYQPFTGQPRPALGSLNPNFFLAGYGDGSVRLLPARIPQETLDRLIDPRDGKEIPDDFP